MNKLLVDIWLLKVVDEGSRGYERYDIRNQRRETFLLYSAEPLAELYSEFMWKGEFGSNEI